MNTDKSIFGLRLDCSGACWCAGIPLTPAQWLPKPATGKFPDKSFALRAPWSPNGGEGDESILHD